MVTFQKLSNKINCTKISFSSKQRFRGKVVVGADSIQAAQSMPNYSGRTKLPLSSLVHSFAKLVLYFQLVSHTLSTMQSRAQSKNSGHPNSSRQPNKAVEQIFDQKQKKAQRPNHQLLACHLDQLLALVFDLEPKSVPFQKYVWRRTKAYFPRCSLEKYRFSFDNPCHTAATAVTLYGDLLVHVLEKLGTTTMAWLSPSSSSFL